jgi:hypothetical protein
MIGWIGEGGDSMKRVVAAACVFLVCASCSAGSRPKYVLPIDCEDLILESQYIEQNLGSSLDVNATPPVEFFPQAGADEIELHTRLESLRVWVKLCRDELTAGFEQVGREGYVSNPSVPTG